MIEMWQIRKVMVLPSEIGDSKIVLRINNILGIVALLDIQPGEPVADIPIYEEFGLRT